MALSYKCFCGGNLKNLEAKLILVIYDDAKYVVCDTCHRYNQCNDLFYHCSNGKNESHPYGWDICNNCIENADCNKIYESKLETLCMQSAISECPQLKRLQIPMELFCKNDYNTDIDSKTTTTIVNNFLHLIDIHNNDQDFQFIVGKLKSCNDGCKSLIRHQRDRNNDQCIKQYTVSNQIMDKIHCYYSHSGKCIESDEKQNDQNHNFIQQRSTRYTQLVDDLVNNSMYEIGLKFKYKYSGEAGSKEFIDVNAKYSSFKKELTSNNLCSMTVQQFDSEYEKATIHFNSSYCRRLFTSYKSDDSRIEWTFSMQHVLALMVYCNYSQLQYEFSKTYRDYKGKSHTNFYFLGLYLKIAIERFGTQVKEEKIKTFYHGIGEQLMLPAFTCGWIHATFVPSNYPCIKECKYFDAIFIHGPVSTTSSFTVAGIFTNNNNGLIIEFNGDATDFKYSRYFAVSWLSDFASENEYLFIQNEHNFEIKNIFDVKLHHEYIGILNALRYLKRIISNKYARNEKIDTKTKNMMDTIVKYQLTDSTCCYSEYAKCVIDRFFAHQKKIDVYFGITINNKNYPVLLDSFYDAKHDQLKLNQIHSLFPNITSLKIIGLSITASVVESVLRDLSDNNDETQLQRITIYPLGKNVLLNDKTMNHYKSRFQKIKYVCTMEILNIIMVYKSE